MRVWRILYNVQRSGQPTIGRDVFKIILLRGIREDYLDMLNLLGKGDIYNESFDHKTYVDDNPRDLPEPAQNIETFSHRNKSQVAEELLEQRLEISLRISKLT